MIFFKNEHHRNLENLFVSKKNTKTEFQSQFKNFYVKDVHTIRMWDIHMATSTDNRKGNTMFNISATL